MSGFEVSQSALVEARVATARAAQQLREDRDGIAREVTALLAGGWAGEAARSFAECWDDWLVGTRDVIDGLDTLARLLDVTRLDYLHHDEQSRLRLDQLSGTLRSGPGQ